MLQVGEEVITKALPCKINRTRLDLQHPGLQQNDRASRRPGFQVFDCRQAEAAATDVTILALLIERWISHNFRRNRLSPKPVPIRQEP